VNTIISPAGRRKAMIEPGNDLLDGPLPARGILQDVRVFGQKPKQHGKVVILLKLEVGRCKQPAPDAHAVGSIGCAWSICIRHDLGNLNITLRLYHAATAACWASTEASPQDVLASMGHRFEAAYLVDQPHNTSIALWDLGIDSHLV